MASVQCKVCGQDNPPEASFCGNCGAALATAVEPPSPAATPAVAVEYMGFWIRFGAALIDSMVVWIISFVLSYFLFRGIYGYQPSFWLSFIWFPLPWLYYWLFTGLKGQTPAKVLVGIKVVNAQGDIPGLSRAALREVLGKIISAIVLFLGFLWIAWDRQKQGWHDMIASTYVIKAKSKW